MGAKDEVTMSNNQEQRYKRPISVRVGNWFMDTKLPIPLKFWIGDKIKYSRLTPDSYWEDI